MDDVSVLVAENLDLDVFGALDVALEEDGGIAKGAFGLVLGVGEIAFERFLVFHDSHAAASTAESCFNNHGEADFLRDALGFVRIGHRIFGAGQGGDVGLMSNVAGAHFIAHFFQHLGRRTDKRDSSVAAGAGKVRVFREKSVTRMDDVDAFVLGERDNALDVQVGTDGAFFPAQLVGFIGFEAVAGKAVFFGVNRDGSKSEFVRRSEDPDGDFAPVHGH